MAAGSRDRPPMLAPGRYPQWLQAVEATDDSPAVPEHTTEAIHLILTGIEDDIYSTVDACQTPQEIWEAIERLQQGQRLISSTTSAGMVKRDKDMQKNLALIVKYFKKIYKPTNNNLRTSSNSMNKNVDTTPRLKNDNQSGQFGIQRTVNVATARENVENTDEEVDEQELEAPYSYMAKIQEVPTADLGTDSEPVEQNEQNDVESDDERVALANLIANLKLDVEEKKKIQKQLKKENIRYK
nr:hypothetical protein [Tanacetum cinerariifolium]